MYVSPFSKSGTFDHYEDVRIFSGWLAISGFIVAIIATCALAGVTHGFQPDSSGYYRIACPIWYGLTGLIIIGSLISFAIASCKMRSLSAPPEYEHEDHNKL